MSDAAVRLPAQAAHPPMRIAVYGAGAVGGHLAVRLAGAGAEVSVVARGAQADAIRAHGLTLLLGEETLHAWLRCAEVPAELGAQDIVVVSVKGTGLDAIAGRIPSLFAPHTRVVFAMNGIMWWFVDGLPIAMPPSVRAQFDPGDALRRAIPMERVVGCAIYSGNVIDRPGVVRSTTPQRNRAILGTPSGAADPLVDAFAALLRRAGIDAEVTPRIRDALWTKMQLIVAASPVCALTRCTLDRVVADPALRALVVDMFEETRRLGVALGLEIPGDSAQRIDFYHDKPIRPSMLQDLEAGKALEVDNGILAFRHIAAAAGHSVPVLDHVATLVAALARSIAPPAIATSS
ncbi:MAG: 2-dehydropantoate 2-reductase [Burkholderiales bacterium]